LPSKYRLFAMALAFVSLYAAQSITDGDTLKRAGVTYRLWGTGAPEAEQDALMDGRRAAWPPPGC